MSTKTVVCALALCVTSALPAVSQARAKAPEPTTGKWAPAVNSKPLSSPVKRGLAWLARAQQTGGGWAQGEESSAMGHSLDKMRDVANVADTCGAALALIRAGSTPRSGPYAQNVARAVKYVCAQIEEADAKSIYITSLRDTRLQMKLGPPIDTFLASLLLAEVKGQMPDPQTEKRLAAAFHKVMDKIEKNQKSDGTWSQEGWAPVLMQSFATKAVNRAAQKGSKVNPQVLARAQGYAGGQFKPGAGGGGSFGGAGSAGVELYSAAGNLSSMQMGGMTDTLREKRLRDLAVNAKTAQERKAASTEVKSIEKNRATYQQATRAVVGKLDDKQFVSGFGSNGGEEFLSYNAIGETLVAKGGPDWKKWDREMTANLTRIQNQDGTWTGHHCITGRTFCTAAALMVLTVDRAPKPLGSEIKRR